VYCVLILVTAAVTSYSLHYTHHIMTLTLRVSVTPCAIMFVHNLFLSLHIQCIFCAPTGHWGLKILDLPRSLYMPGCVYSQQKCYSNFHHAIVFTTSCSRLTSCQSYKVFLTLSSSMLGMNKESYYQTPTSFGIIMCDML